MGEFRLGKREGKGRYVYSNIDKRKEYFGDWLNDERHGQATLTWKTGDTYLGDFDSDLFHGSGTYTWHEGDSYQGLWLRGEREGFGVFKHGKGTLKGDQYQGMHKDS